MKHNTKLNKTHNLRGILIIVHEYSQNFKPTNKKIIFIVFDVETVLVVEFYEVIHVIEHTQKISLTSL